MTHHWIALMLAVAANVGANIAFKYLVQNTDARPTWSTIPAAAAQPALWIGLVLGVTLLLAYLYALKGIPLSVAYTTATSLSIAAVTCAGVLIYGEAFSLRMAFGIAAVMAGLFLISTA
jgi:multidrug transporter EmrE-like cation transporter